MYNGIKRESFQNPNFGLITNVSAIIIEMKSVTLLLVPLRLGHDVIAILHSEGKPLKSNFPCIQWPGPGALGPGSGT